MKNGHTQTTHAGLLYEKYKGNRAVTAINRVVGADVFYLLVAALCAVSFVFSLELPVYTVYTGIILAIVLFGEKVERLLIVIPFFYIAPSQIQNPALSADSIFLHRPSLLYMGVLLCVSLAGILTLTVRCVSRRRISSPLLWRGYLVLGAAYMCSGIFSPGGTWKNFAFSLVEVLSVSILYFLGVCLIDGETHDASMFAKIGAAIALVLIIEVFDIYLVREVFARGYLRRRDIYAGWGIYNNIGNMMCVSIPCIFYMMCCAKRKTLWFWYVCVLMVALVLTTSRGSILTGVLLFVFSLVYSLFRIKEKKAVRGIVWTVGIGAVLACGVFAFLWSKYEVVRATVEKALNFGILNDAGRFKAWREGMTQFFKYPIFGGGFYECSAYLFYKGWGGFLPARWHNTVVQLFAACGTVGFAAYVYHRVQTVRLFLRMKTGEGVFLALSIFAILFGSMTDNHFFNIGPGLVYGLFLAFVEVQVLRLPRDSLPLA